MGIVFLAESDKLTTTSQDLEKGSVRFDVRKIDFIYNPEYEILNNQYNLPVFFKSTLSNPNRIPYIKQGFLDNGRHKITLRDPESPQINNPDF